jgi:hypothetical protein
VVSCMDFPLNPSFGTKNLDTAPQCASFLGTFTSLKSSCCCQRFANDGKECPNVRWEIRPMFFWCCPIYLLPKNHRIWLSNQQFVFGCLQFFGGYHLVYHGLSMTHLISKYVTCSWFIYDPFDDF